VQWHWQGKPEEYSDRNAVSVSIFPARIPDVLFRSRFRASAVKGRLLRRSENRHGQIAGISCVMDSICIQALASAATRHSCSSGEPSCLHFSELNEIKQLIMFVRTFNESPRHVSFHCMWCSKRWPQQNRLHSGRQSVNKGLHWPWYISLTWLLHSE
jgi:hypothetical protein